MALALFAAVATLTACVALPAEAHGQVAGGQTTVTPGSGSPGTAITVKGSGAARDTDYFIRLLNFANEAGPPQTCRSKTGASHPDIIRGASVRSDKKGVLPTVARTIPTDIHPSDPALNHGAHASNSGNGGSALVCHPTSGYGATTKPAGVTVLAGVGEGTGELSFYGFEEQSLTDRSGLAVNLANGNLLVRSRDLRIVGTGLDLVLARFYNSLSSTPGSVGSGWGMGTGEDVRIYDDYDGSVTFYGPSGYVVLFGKRPDGTFDSPPGLRATLKRLTDSTYELIDNPTGEALAFTSSGRNSWGRLTGHADRYGNRLGFAYSAGRLASITDTRGRVVTATPDASGRLAKLTDPSGRTLEYGYDAQGRLQAYTDPAAKRTTYGYDGSNRLASITSPAGRVTRITYNGGRVAAIVRTTDANRTTGPTTTFTYGSGAPCAAGETKTVVSDPLATGSNGHATTYCSDARGAVTKRVDSSGNTSSAKYDANGSPTSLTRPGGGVTNLKWDSATRRLLCAQRGATAVGDCQSASGGLRRRSPTRTRTR